MARLNPAFHSIPNQFCSPVFPTSEWQRVMRPRMKREKKGRLEDGHQNKIGRDSEIKHSRQKAFQRPPSPAAETHFIKARLWFVTRHTKRDLTEHFTEKLEQRCHPDVALPTRLSRVISGLLPMAFFLLLKFNGGRFTN